MNLKQYSKIRLIIVIILAALVGQLIVRKSFVIPVALLAAASLILLYLRKRVEGVVSDERDYAIGGKSALMAIQIYSWIAVVATFFLYSIRDLNPHYEAVGITLAFSTCFLLMSYSIIFRYYNKIKFSDRKIFFSVIVMLIIVLATIVTLRTFSGEDGWVCEDGKWIEHGKPDFLAPNKECK